ncbi:sterol desaturase family protein [Epibacterium sp. Ofav1-8]|uniref:sterol desaturase family protein n=1 Tax=Epibacterium sp. Ofav1-8 TaxID=2917735 RepID=UPI001EF63D16|nr:sterol desaturase family protein [Epibacterium sp. Ofav1-8]
MEFLGHLGDVFSDFHDPKKRIFVGYLLAAILIALLWLVAVRRCSFRDALQKVFDRSILWSASARADYKIFVINRIFTLFISPLLLSQLAIATAVYYLLLDLPVLHRELFSDAPVALVTVLFTVTIFLMDDLTKYVLHRMMHRWPLLWAIHKVHHSAETMTPVTVYRVHPLEGVLYAFRTAFVQGSVMASFLFLFGPSVDLVTVLGVSVFSFVFHVAGSNLRHSHISIRYWPWLEHLLISPAQHQIHHSSAKRHYDKNFGVAFALWDWLFGSLHLSEPDTELTFGLSQTEAHASDIRNIYLRPFADMYAVIRRRLPRRRPRATAAVKSQR